MIEMLKQTFEEWRGDSIGVLAAGLAFYAVLALAPLLIIVIGVVRFFGRGDARAVILGRIEDVSGSEATQLVRAMIESRDASGADPVATVVGVALLVFSATGVLAQLQHAFHTIWNVKVDPRRSGVLHTLRVRVLSLSMILGLGLLLLAAMVGTSVLRYGMAEAQGQLPWISVAWTLLDPLILVAVSTLVFASLLKVLPNVHIPWRAVVVGGAVTAVGFVLANWLMSAYLIRPAVAGTYGAGGAVIVILLWVFVLSQIVLLGAEFTQVYARRTGERIVPDEHTVPRRR